MNFWQGLPKSRQPGQGKQGANFSYENLRLAIKDPLIPLKLQFLEGIASELNSFLITFQSDKPMIPFLVETLEELLRLLCVKFIGKDTLDAACTTYALLKVDVTDTSNHKNASDIDLGFALKHGIKILRSSKKYSEIQKKQCSSL